MSWSHTPWAANNPIDAFISMPESSKSKKAAAIDESPVSITAQPFDDLPPKISLDSPVLGRKSWSGGLDSPALHCTDILLLPGINLGTYRLCALFAIAVVIIAPVASATQWLLSFNLPWGVLAAGMRHHDTAPARASQTCAHRTDRDHLHVRRQASALS